MFNRHFFRMLIALMGMILLGILGLMLINESEGNRSPSDGSILPDIRN